MPKGSHFVVPLDESPGAPATLSTAFAFAKSCGARVDILEIVPARRPTLLGDDADSRLAHRESSRGDRSRLAGSIESARRRRIDVRTIGYRGNPLKIIPSYAHLTKATLIVVDQHYGTSRWRRNTRVVNELARSAPVPVLVLPAQHGPAKDGMAPFRHILSAIDLTVASAVALRTVVDLARRSGARLTLVHALNAPEHMVFSSGDAARIRRHLPAQTDNIAERMRRKIPSNVDIQVDVRVTTGDPHRAILTVASEVDADLVVMGVPPRSRLDEVLFGSTLRRVVRRTNVPLLVIPVAAGAHKWLDDTEGVELPVTARTRHRSRY